MLCEKCLEVVPDVLDQSDSQEHVARLALDWFERHLVANTDEAG
jgi:hypothetical protein